MCTNLVDVQSLYDKDKDLKQDDVRKLQVWLEKQPHLPQITELQVALFLQSCYCSNEAAKQALDNYFTIKTLCQDIFGNRNVADAGFKETMNVSMLNILPKLTPEGYCINYMKLVDCDPDHFHFINQLKQFDMLTMLHLSKCGPCNGYVLVLDMEGSVFGHLTKVNLIVVKKFLFYLQEAMPVRLKGIHLVNIVSWADKLVALLKPFMKKELFDMLYLHPGLGGDFPKFVPKECLPNDYGGQCESIAVLHEKTKQFLNDNAEFFKWEDTQLVDESKRVGKAKGEGDFFGIEGTFKKLQVD